jgi:flavin reductase (DIM6/NTAB) family NADH-FMN oxidoreductase RutF
MAIDEQAFKQALSQWASGITVITSCEPDGTFKGMTASSFSSISKNPPLIMVCVAKHLYTHQVIEQNGAFAVNILSTEQEYWGRLFAGMHPEVENRWEDIQTQTAETGCPILPGVLGWVDCRLFQKIDAGDHSIFVGKVLAADGTGMGNPLMYFNRQWGTFSPK